MLPYADPCALLNAVFCGRDLDELRKRLVRRLRMRASAWRTSGHGGTVLSVPTLSDALRVVNDLATDGVIETYAVGGAMAMLFWAEPTVTFDLDIFVHFPTSTEGPIVSLEPIYRVLRARGCEVVAEHVVIHGTPVQFLVSPNALADEAITTAAPQDLDGVGFRVMRPEYLAALWLQAGGAKRRERVSLLRQAGVLDEARLAELLRRYGITPS